MVALMTTETSPLTGAARSGSARSGSARSGAARSGSARGLDESGRPRLALVGTEEAGGPAPALLAAGARRLHPSVYRRRRLAVVSLAIVGAALALAVLFAAGSASARTGGGPLTATGVSGPASLAAERVWVVRPGDTLWGIARAVDPGGDVRGLVDRMEAEAGSATLYPGESIRIPIGG